MKYAKDEICSEEHCSKQAEVFWPAFDPDIRSYPFCRECVDKVKLEVLLKLYDKD